MIPKITSEVILPIIRFSSLCWLRKTFFTNSLELHHVRLQAISPKHHPFLVKTSFNMPDLSADDTDNMVMMILISRFQAERIEAFPSESCQAEQHPAGSKRFEITVYSRKSAPAEIML
jgi:hypothetical protein